MRPWKAKTKKRVFVSFDDRILKDFVIWQCEKSDSPVQVEDSSMEGTPDPGIWEEETRERIGRSDVVIVIVGDWTHRALGVLREVEIAREVGVPVHQLVGYKDSLPDPVPDAGPLLRWKWRDVKKMFG